MFLLVVQLGPSIHIQYDTELPSFRPCLLSSNGGKKQLIKFENAYLYKTTKLSCND